MDAIRELAREPGWNGVFTRYQAEGAYANGTRVQKTMAEARDGHPDGARATILGSISAPDHGYGYFVEWDDTPRHAVFIAANRIAPEDGG